MEHWTEQLEQKASELREHVASVRCPHCGAAAGECCVGRLEEGASHAPRVDRGLYIMRKLEYISILTEPGSSSDEHRKAEALGRKLENKRHAWAQ